MNYDNEIDEILNSLKERREREAKLENSSGKENNSTPLTFSSFIRKNESQENRTEFKINSAEEKVFSEPLAKPKMKQDEQPVTQAEIKTEPEAINNVKNKEKAEIKVEIRAENDAPLEAPKPSKAEFSEEKKEPQPKKLIWYDSKKEFKKQTKKSGKKQKEKRDKKKLDLSKIKDTAKSLFSKKEKSESRINTKEKFKSIFSAVKINFKRRIFPILKKIFTKQLLFAILIIAVLTGAVFGGIKLYDYSKVAYLKPYEEKYNIDYPQGILKEFCDAYGENQNIRGELIIEDTNTKKYAANQITADYPYLKYECDINKQEHFRTIDVSKSYADLESIYSTAEGFISSSQKVTFNTLFEKADYNVIAAFYTNKNAKDDNGYVFPYNLYGNMTEDSFSQFRDRIKSRRLYNTGTLPKYDDYVLTLSVDSDFMKDFKFVVVCIKNTNKKFEKSDIAEINPHIHYPQVWYNTNKQENPYRYAKHWYPELYTDDEPAQTKQLTIEDFEQ